MPTHTLYTINLSIQLIPSHIFYYSIVETSLNLSSQQTSGSKNTLRLSTYIHHSCSFRHHWTYCGQRLHIPSTSYPPPSFLSFTDQFAFRPSVSTTATLITILHTIANLLTTNQFVIVIAFDFSKAFDIVRHSTLLNKYFQMEWWTSRTIHTTGLSITSKATRTARSTVNKRPHFVRYRPASSMDLPSDLHSTSSSQQIFVPSHRETVFASTPMIRISSSRRSMFTVERRRLTMWKRGPARTIFN